MHQNPNSTNNPGREANSNKPYTVSSHPWWRGIGHDGFSQDMLGESMTDITAAEQQANGDSRSKTSKSQVKGGLDEGNEANKEIQVIAMSQSDGKFGAQNPQQYTASIVHQPVGEYVTPPAQLELVGHNIACASYPFSDSYYGGVVPAYGPAPQAFVHSHCVGVHQARMVLPLEMAEEPVYVNAKQYHGILRRRQIRAKAELEKKLIKVRKPYLHESRHLHAMRRARGCGGRFLNTKKVDAHASNAAHDNATNSTLTVSTHPTNSTGSGSMFSKNTSGNSSTVQMQPQLKYSDGDGNGNGFYPQHQGFQLFRYNPLSDDSMKRGDFSGKKSERIVVNGAQNRALTIK